MSQSLATLQLENRRLLVIDDNPSIHEDFRKVLTPADTALAAHLDDDEAALFGEAHARVSSSRNFEIDSAFQGEEGLGKVRAAAADGRPYAVAFVDVRMPPGWDGIETISRIWKEFPDLQVVVCTAYSDYSWDDIATTIGNTDQMLVLKKPFDNVEVLQMAHALARKYDLTLIAHRQLADLEKLVDARTADLRAANVELTSEIGERTMAETALRHSEERFAKAFQGNPLPMAIRRPDIRGYVDVNASFAALVGTSRAEALDSDAPLWTDPTTDAELAAQLSKQEVIREMPSSIQTRTGESRDVLVTAQILRLDNAPYQLLILQDVTERTRLENDLRQAQKMEAVGRLAAGVAHDFNNILTVIIGNTALHLREPQLDEKLTISLQQVARAAERATALTRQLLAYSRKQIIHRRPLALNEVVEQTVGMLRRIIGEHISLEMQLTRDLSPVFADPSSVDQVIMNLALNARDAMPGGGRLTLATFEVEIDEAIRAGRPEAQLGRHICLAVRDTGSGMDEATVDRIFEPFFTTKAPGEGTGMGLATAYGVMKQHGGWIEVESEPDRGTTIRTFFPVSLEALPTVTAEPPCPSIITAPVENVTILVVEDEEMLRDFVEQALNEAGYRVLTAPSGREALKVWAANRAKIDLLLTDVIMPDSMSGQQLAQALLMDKPDLKVIFTSGYSAELLGEQFEQETRYGFLPKPYLPDDLVATIAHYLQREPEMAF